MRKYFFSLLVSLVFTGVVQAQPAAFRTGLPGLRPAVARLTVATARPTASQLLEALVQEYTNGSWNDVARSVYLRYSAPQLPSQIRTDFKLGPDWTPFALNRLRYNAAGLVLTDSLDQLQPPLNGPRSAQVNTYTTPTRLLWEWSLARSPLAPPTAPWDSVARSTHTYNPAGQLTQVVQQSYMARTYTDALRQLFSYNAQGKLSVLETQSSVAGAWQPDMRATYTYNAAGQEQQVVTETANNPTRTYVNASRETLQYDAQNRVNLLTSEEWVAGAWQVESQALYAYNTLNDLLSITLQDWNGSAFVNGQRVLFTYQQTTPVRQPAWQPLAVAPNPSRPDAQAQLVLEAGTEAVTGAVYDQAGRRVATLAATVGQARRGFLQLPPELPTGLYLVRLHGATRQWQARWSKL